MALDPDVQQRIAQLWPTLAEPVKSNITGQEYTHAVRNATMQLVLDERILVEIELEALLVLLGLQTPEEFAAYLPTIEGLSPHDAAAIAADIQHNLFSLLAPYLSTPETPQATPPAAAQPGSHPLSAGGSASPLEQFVVKDPAVQERFAKLPESVREAILAQDVANAFSTTVRSYDLDQQQFVILGSLAVQVMVGLATTKDFRTRATEQQLVGADHIKPLVADVEQHMFKPVRDAIVQALHKRKQG